MSDANGRGEASGGGDDPQTELRDSDPRRIRSLAVHTDDVLTALEARERGRTAAVLRVTPPFAGRMRARLHVEGGEGEYDQGESPLHLAPRAFLAGVPPFPTVDATEDELREAGEYSVERHRERHAAAVAEWRETVRGRLRDRIDVRTPNGPHRVAVSYLG